MNRRTAAIGCSGLTLAAATALLAVFVLGIGRPPGSPDPTEPRITAVNVDPAGRAHRQGDVDERLVTVNYVQTQLGRQLRCSFPSESGSDRLTIANDSGVSTGSAIDATWMFRVDAPATAGAYQIDCSIDEVEDSAMSTTYWVSEATPSPTASAPSTAAGDPRLQFTRASLAIDWAHATAASGDLVNIFTCSQNPPAPGELTLKADGTLTGTCIHTFLTPGMSAEPTQITGLWDWREDGSQGRGAITFSISTTTTVISSSVSGAATWEVELTSYDREPGVFVSDTVAQGRASWTNACDANGALTCFAPGLTHKEAWGKVPWTMTFLP